MKLNKAFLNWSSGKDAALSLYELQQSPKFEVVHLLTSINKFYDRVTMHGLRVDLLKKQISALDLPYSIVELPKSPSNEVYEEKMNQALDKMLGLGCTHAAFGDIFLEDLKKYRESQLARKNVKAVFPLWKNDTLEIAKRFIGLGFKAIIVCVDGSKLDQSFAGRFFDESFLADLPSSVDPCGENGEFHTFCYAGPIFKNKINFERNGLEKRVYKHEKEQFVFWFEDLV